jgi:acyl-CoA synthetase (AMP-forming)/AMP-acid ligase II
MSQPTHISVDDLAVDADAAALARFLSTAGCRPGDRVALLAGNTPQHLAARLAAASLGLVMVPINTSLAPPEVAWILANAHPRVVLPGSLAPPAGAGPK